MSEMAKKARAAMKEKAQRMGSDRPLEKVDSSSWTPPAKLNADVKTGMRPLRRRAYKEGGKVEGLEAKKRSDRKARKSGGATGEQPTVDRFMNRDYVKANEYREGKKHVGALKRGGRAGLSGGGTEDDRPSIFKSKDPAMQRALDSVYESTRPENLRKMLRENEDRRLADPEYQSYLKRKGLPTTNKWADESRTLNEIYTGKTKRTPKCSGGSMKKRGKYADGQAVPTPPDMPEDVRRSRELEAIVKRDPHEMTPAQQERARQLGTPRTYSPDQKKKGGRVGKFMGGPMMQPGGMASIGAGALSGGAGVGSGLAPSGAMTNPNPFMPDPRLGIVNKDALNFGSGARGSPYKKGGKVAHGDEAADKALIRKMVKASARTGKNDGGEMSGGAGSGKRTDRPENVYSPQYNEASVDKAISSSREKIGKKEGKAIKSLLGGWQERVKKYGRAEGGGVFSGKGYPGKVPGATGGRTAHAAGGAAKGKGRTDIKIYVSAGQKQPMAGPMDGAGVVPPPPVGGPAGRPVPVPPPAGGPAPAPMAMPIPMPMPSGGGAPAPMPRKAGGRISKVASSYKDMEAGAGSGEGRLQKTDIAKRSNHNEGGKVGHRSYKSYKDMDAGAGSGFGRLEKTAIAKKTA